VLRKSKVEQFDGEKLDFALILETPDIRKGLEPFNFLEID